MTVSKDHYYKLASDLEAERIQGASGLLSELQSADSTKDWEYTFDRLVKGLSSSRASARLGFSLCLSEVLDVLILKKQLYTVDQYLIELDSKLRANKGKANGRNERGFLFGKLFGIQSLLNSSVIAHFLSEQEYRPAETVYRELLEVALAKSWIRETVFFTIVSSIEKLRLLENKPIILFLLKKVDEDGLTYTTEGLLLYLSLPLEFKTDLCSEENLGFWKNGDPLCSANLNTLAGVLKDTARSDPNDDDHKHQKASWSPRLHCVWGILLKQLLSRQEDDEETISDSKKRKKHSKKEKKKKRKDASQLETTTISQFWKNVIEDQFFSSTASPERKFSGLQIFELVLTQSPMVNEVFSPNLLRCLINQSANQERLLNCKAKQCLNLVVERCQAVSEITLPVLTKLLTEPCGSLNFDRLTKTKTVDSILKNFPLPIMGELVSLLKSWLDKNDDEKMKTFAADTLLHLVRYKKAEVDKQLKSCEVDISWADSILEVLIAMSFFKNSNQNEKLASLCQQRFNSILSEVIHWPRADGLSWPYYALTKVEELQSNLELTASFGADLKELKDGALSTIKSIREILEQKSVKILSCFELLFSMTLLQMYAGDGESAGILQELNVSYEKCTEENNEDGVSSVDMLLEITLSFISQQSSLMKKLSLIVWESISQDLTSKHLDSLYDILLTRENKEGQEKLFAGEGEAEAESEEESNDESKGNSSDDEGEGSSSDSDENQEIDMRTNQQLAEAFNIPMESGEVKFDSDDDDEDESAEESMDDEQMMALDTHLSAIFHQRQTALDEGKVKTGNQRKLEAEQARDRMIFFKKRVLDLLELYADTTHNEQIVGMIVPLLEAIALTQDKSVGERVVKLLKQKVCRGKLTVETIDKEALLKVIRRIHDICSSSSIAALSTCCSQCSIFVAKVIVSNEENSIAEVVDVYNESTKRFATSVTKLPTSLFFDFINWLNTKRPQKSI